MKLLYLAGSTEHSHDYGLAFLFDGLVNVLGYDNVIDYPANPTFHLPSPDDRDECCLDSDLFFPPRPTPPLAEFDSVDAIILGVPDVTAYRVCRAIRKPVIAVDMSDQVVDLRGVYRTTAGRPLAAYLKREVPMDADWGIPFPMCYPASRAPIPMPAKLPRIVYHATDHGGGAPGIPRRKIVAQLRAMLPADMLDIGLYPGQAKGTRPSPEELHLKMAEGTVGISWNGAPNWQSNRFFENFAFALAQVSERPKHQFPNAPVDGVDCLYADTPEQAATLAAELVRDEARTKQIAYAGHAWFMQHHSSKARARELIEIVRRCV